MSDHSSAVDGIARIALWAIRFAIGLTCLFAFLGFLGWITS